MTHLDRWLQSWALTAADGWPVHEVQIQLVQLEILQGLLTGIPHPGMILVEQLGRHPDVISGDVALRKHLLEGLAHGVLIAVC